MGGHKDMYRFPNILVASHCLLLEEIYGSIQFGLITSFPGKKDKNLFQDVCVHACVREREWERERERHTSNLPSDRLKAIMTDRRTSCLAYLIRNVCDEKLWSVSSILHTPSISSGPKLGAAAQQTCYCILALSSSKRNQTTTSLQNS